MPPPWPMQWRSEMASNTPLLSEVLEAAIVAALDDVRTQLPGRIEAYDSAQHVATVQLLVRDARITETGERVLVTPAPLTGVPVGSVGFGTCRIKIPVPIGARCWVSFSSSSLAALKSSDWTSVTDPTDDRRHHIADAVVMPLVFVAADDAAQIEFTDTGLIRAGGDE